MNIIKRILGHLYYVYGMVIFLITLLLIAFPLSALSLQFPEPRRAKVVHWSYRLWMEIMLPLVFIFVKRSGKEQFEKGENYVVVLNHNSFVDILVSTPWVPGPNKTLAKSELATIPVFGTVYRTGSILVKREDDKSRKESFVEMQRTLKMGLHLILYPEGTRNKTDQPMGTFHDGAFVTAIRAQKPVIPGVLLHTKGILPERPKFWAWPSPVKICFLPPVPTKGMSLRDAETLKNTIHQQMLNFIVQHQK